MARRPPRCPDCGAPLTIDPTGIVVDEYATPYHVIGEPIPTRERPAPIAGCARCEFVIEIDLRL